MQRRFEVGAKVYSSQFGVGEVTAVEGFGESEALTVRFDTAGERRIMTSTHVLEPAEPPPAVAIAPAVDVTEDAAGAGALEETLRRVLREELGLPEIGMMERWKGGTVVIRPGRDGQKPKEIPIDDLFHKIVMLRDRLRVLEQKINAHTVLSDADKVELQQYITRIYGTLTTFNVLFADRDDWFVGQKGS